jgi:CheY-like chemotaxis protein
MSKPIRLHRLLRVLRELLATSTSSGSLELQNGPQSGQIAALNLAPPRVLVAEDNPANQRLTELMLLRFGCRVDLVADGVEAVAAAARFPYDLILMDSQMPEMDGLTATAKIRKLSQAMRTVPIVALTASAFATDRERHLRAGMDDFLTKPLTADALRGVLRRILPRHYPSDAPPLSIPETSRPLTAPPAPSVPSPPMDSSAADDLAGLQSDSVDIKRRLADLSFDFGTHHTQAIRSIIKVDWPRTLKSLDHSMLVRDYHGISRSAHYLSGSALQVNAQRLAERCRELQSAAQQAHAEKISKLLPVLALHITQLISEL